MKGYWIAQVDVNDPEAYQAYVAANARAFNKFQAKFLIRGGHHVLKEGQTRARLVVLEFKDYATALACYDSPEYAEAKRLRGAAAKSDLVIVEGYDGVQPSG